MGQSEHVIAAQAAGMELNKSGLEPAGVAVLVRQYMPRAKDSKIVIPEHAQTRVAMVDTMAEVIAVGPSAWHDEPRPRAAVGDIVLITKFAGFVAIGPADKCVYRLVNDRDIFCRVTHKEEDKNG